MNGPEHYAEAERLLGTAQDEVEDYARASTAQAEALHWQQSQWAQERAQVHATLALAAATAEPIAQAYAGPDDTTVPRAWSQAIA